MDRRHFVIAGSGALASVLAARDAHAQTAEPPSAYPSRPIKMVVAFGPGGPEAGWTVGIELAGSDPLIAPVAVPDAAAAPRFLSDTETRLVSGIASHGTLTEEERSARAHALADSRLREAEERKIAEEEAKIRALRESSERAERETFPSGSLPPWQRTQCAARTGFTRET